MWVRGGNLGYLYKKLQEGINQIEMWGTDWGFNFSVEKTKGMFFTRKKIREGMTIKLNGNKLENVRSVCVLGVHLDPRLHGKYMMEA